MRDEGPGLHPSDATKLRRATDLLNSHPQVGSVVSPSELRGMAARIEAMLAEPPSPTAAGMLEEIRDLFVYSRWANGRLLDVVAELTPEQFHRDLGSSFPSVQTTLAHMLGVDWLWLQRWGGVSPAGLPAEWDLSTFTTLRMQWRSVEEERTAFLARLTEADLASTIAYRNVAGEAFEALLWQLLRHVANHSTFHRGQVVTMLRQLGVSRVPATDLSIFYREQAQQAETSASRPA